MTTTRPTRRLPSLSRTIALGALAALVGACATRTPAPIVDRTTTAPALPAPSPAPIVAAPSAPSATPAPLPAPAAAPPPTYVVKRGDTLRQIANEVGVETRDLAAWNNIENVNVIRVGQALRLTPPGSEAAAAAVPPPPGTTITPLRAVPPVAAGETRVAAAPGVSAAPSPPTPAVAAPPSRASDGQLRSGPKAVKEPWSEQAVREVARTGGGLDALVAKAEPRATAPSPPAAAAAPPPSPAATPPLFGNPPATVAPAPAPSPGDDEGLDWVWPAKGKLVAQFAESASLKGIDIAGSAGDAVVASAPGRVVYAGSGLRGYGKLVIIKHNSTYLTAYAHNNNILVKEGQAVTRGQKIAEMGSSDTDRVKLHFEIRRLGKPMDPLRFLPPA
jgi:lipoprotein NlpD